MGDTIEFQFFPTDHWVIRSDFNYPCIPYEYLNHNDPGFSSGTQVVRSITEAVSSTLLWRAERHAN